MAVTSASKPAAPAVLHRDQLLELYYYMRLTRSLEERLVNLYRQTKVVGGLFRSLGQEADAVGSAYALDRDKGDMVPVMAGVALSFKMRKQDRVVLVYVGDGATSTGAFHEGINFAAVQRLPMVVVVENNGYAYSTPLAKQTAVVELKDKAVGYGIPGVRADGNDVLAVYDVTKAAVDRARRGEGVTLIELVTYRRKGHAEHDNQSYVPPGEIDRWATENDPIDRFVAVLRDRDGVTDAELQAQDARAQAVI